ncbi:MAG: hypothetical protein AB1297_06395 [bacterium]
MNWKEKDKKVRGVLAKRLSLLREKGDEILREEDQKCRFKQAKDTLSLIKAIDRCLDLIRFTNYGYSDFEIRDYGAIEEKFRGIFEKLEEVEQDFDKRNSDFIFHIRKARTGIESLKKDYEEIKSLIMAFSPHKEEKPLLNED